MEKGNKGLKVTLILILFLIIAVVLEASLISTYEYYVGVECPNCGSTKTILWESEETKYKCTNCGAVFWDESYGGGILYYDEGINKNYRQNHINKPTLS